MLSSTFERVFSKVYHKSYGDDTTDSEIMAYSAMGADVAATDDEPAFGAGGAIMEALVQNNPSLRLLQSAKKLSQRPKETSSKSEKTTKPPKKSAVKKAMKPKGVAKKKAEAGEKLIENIPV